MYTPQGKTVAKPPIDKETVGWPSGYMSTSQDGVVPETAFTDMTNWDMSQNSLPFIRASTAPYGVPFLGTCIGIGTLEKTNNVLANGIGKEHWEISVQKTATNEIKTLTITGSPTGGTFTLTYSGQTTAAIARNATAATVQSALQALSNVGTGQMICTGGPLPGSAITITCEGTLANTDVANITTTSSLTGGTSPAVAVAETLKGGNRGALYTRKDGSAWTLVTGNYRYDPAAWMSFAQSNNRVFMANGVDNLSYYDIAAGDIITYTEISKPTTPTATETALTGTTYDLFYVVTAFNESGETDESPEATVAVNALRESWDGTTEFVDVSWSAVSGAAGYYVYVGTVIGTYDLIAVINNGTTFRDFGTNASTVTKRPPLTNATGGPIVTFLCNILGQIFAWGDINNPSFIWYDGGNVGIDGSGNFTVSGGGGYIGIDDGGPSIPVCVVPFRTGKGDPAPTVICRGPAGTGGIRHIEFTPETIGNLTALMPAIDEANGYVGGISPMACVSDLDSIHFPTAVGFMYEGSAPNIVGILDASRSSDFIQPDVEKLNMSAMSKSCGLFFEGRIYWSLPVLSSTNSQMWVLDLKANPTRWIMPWTIPAQYLWLYEDNSGRTHFCMLVNGQEVEFTNSSYSNDCGVPFRTRLASGPLRWDKSGIHIGYIQAQRFKTANERGHIDINVYGTDQDAQEIIESGNIDAASSESETGWGESIWGEDDWGEDPDVSVAGLGSTLPPTVIPIKTKLSELRWEMTTADSGCACSLSATQTQGVLVPKLYAGG